jgi:cytochrome b561
MQWKNTSSHYGAITKLFHWTFFLLFIYQYAVAMNMVNMENNETALGIFTQNTLYNWHKTIGILLLIFAFARYMWRRNTPLPGWAPTLSSFERKASHWIERLLYICMFLMPISGFIFVMAGGYGVLLFGRFPLPNMIPVNETLAEIAQTTHHFTAYALLIVWLCHLTLVLKQQFINRDRFLNRMLPFTHQ